MKSLANPFNSLKHFPLNSHQEGLFYSLPALEAAKLGPIATLPVCLRILLENLLRNYDAKLITEQSIQNLANWPKAAPHEEIFFTVSRVLLQDFTGVPLMVDLAAMREAVHTLGKEASLIEPLVPVDLVVDHSVQVDKAGSSEAFELNLKKEFERNKERYAFLKWGQQAFKTFRVIPPGIGIVHQVNLEYLAQMIFSKHTEAGTLYYPDTLVGTDSHTTMINGLGIVGWGVGGIEAEASMLGQALSVPMPKVVGVNLIGKLPSQTTATDLALHITDVLRKVNVTGQFVEFHGEGAASLSVSDRATLANMSPEYGATIGYFPIDEQSLSYLEATGRSKEHIAKIERYYKTQGLWGMPKAGQLNYSQVVSVDLAKITPLVAGPKRPQDSIDLLSLKTRFKHLLQAPIQEGGYGLSLGTQTQKTSKNTSKAPSSPQDSKLSHGSIVIAAITSCTNTSNPHVMLGAGLLAKKAVEAGLSIHPSIKCSLAPGSRVVTDYLQKTRLLPYLEMLGFHIVGYGCTTCIGNSGPLAEEVEQSIQAESLVVASVLSGNRNFEARIHNLVQANFLMSPPLVVASALAGTVCFNFNTDPLGTNREGKPIFLKDIWPSELEIEQALLKGLSPEQFKEKYANIESESPENWKAIQVPASTRYPWDANSTYIKQPPFFEGFKIQKPELPSFEKMQILALLGDSVTTDHISPAGFIAENSPAGHYLIQKGVQPAQFNSYGSRRGNDAVMIRGTLANIRLKNKMVAEIGGFTRHPETGKTTSIYEAAEAHRKSSTPLIIFAGKDYGMGSSRDWAAKGTALLGVCVVVASSFERIHRSNLIGMGVLPLCFQPGTCIESLKLKGTETCSFVNFKGILEPKETIELRIDFPEGHSQHCQLKSRLNTPMEVDYFKHRGILNYVLRQLLEA